MLRSNMAKIKSIKRILDKIGKINYICYSNFEL